LRTHDGDEPHFHDWSEEERAAVAEAIWQAENVELTTVGIDVGSSTSHLMFARVRLQRKTQHLSSEFVVVSREIVWRSPIVFTPFLADFTIDADRLAQFIESAYEHAGLTPADVDTGAVILTGEAIKRNNAEAIARIFASQAGKFVCASAGHHMECVLAAHGGGATAISRRTHRTVLNVDIGGGTTKLALIRNGEIVATCAFAAGGRLFVQDDAGRLTRIEEPARQVARALGIELRAGQVLAAAERDRLATAFAEVVIAMIGGRPAELSAATIEGLARELLLTAPLGVCPAETGGLSRPHLVTFTGGVSEYIFGRETQTFGDLAKPLAERVAGAFTGGRIDAALLDPGQGIRATVIGASQFTAQLSGKTIHISEGIELPVHNVPVAFPSLFLGEDFDAASVAAAIRAALERVGDGVESAQRPIALGIRWQGEPHYRRLRALADGIARGLDGQAAGPLILMIDRDIARLLGHILEHELQVGRGVVAIDGVQLREFDFVDIGEVIRPAHVVPVVIKSLLFPVH
jgi:ethanolamine utilization protein EutA